MTFHLAFMLLHLFGRKHILNPWGRKFYSAYKKLANAKLRELRNELPPRVDAHYDFNYKFVVAYVAIYDALLKMNVKDRDIDLVIWKMNESLLDRIPRRLLMGGEITQKEIDGLRSYQEMGEKGLLTENDWTIKVEQEGDGSVHVVFTQCGAYNILTRRGYGFVFPCACRIDHLMANKSGMKFARTKTIADGDGVCDNHMMGPGFTEWAPEKGFVDRK